MKKINVTIVRAIAFIAVLAVFVGFVKKDDDPVIDKIVSRLADWLDSNQPEKIYLQTDKPFYAAGDDIWFKAYVTVGSDHKLSALSKVINVELIDQHDSVTKWIKLPMVNGTAWGDIALSDTLHEGSYRIRAYTNWMRNAGPDYYFDKVITIANAPADPVFTKTNYTYATVKNQQQVTATISYANIDGKPYAAKPVNYKVQFNGKVSTRGKGVTDDKGNIVIDFIKPVSAQADKGNIITDIKLTEQNTITKTVTISATSGSVDVQFFPESGSLVNGVPSKVAFKAVGPDGLGQDIKGVVVDNENNKVSAFATRHLGMGEFLIVPKAGKTYKALIINPDGSQSTVALPAAVNSGYVLNIHESDSTSVMIKVIASSDLETSGQVYLLAQSGGQTCFVGKNPPGKASFLVNLPKSKFPSGIVQFTLFTNTGEPINERVVFIKNVADLLDLKISPAKTVSAPREKVKIDLDVQNIASKSVIGSFSASVINESKLKADESAETTILSHILLTSDLRGYIEQPNYYFRNNDDTTRANLDILMLTQGYRRFEWKPLLADKIPAPTYEAGKSINVSGNVKTLTGKPVANAKITLFSTAATGQVMLDTVADQRGDFTFKNLFLKDSTRFVIKAYNATGGKNVTIKMNNGEDREVKNQYLSAINFNTNDESFAAYLKANKNLYDEEIKYGLGNHNIALKEVTIKEHKKPVLAHSSNRNGPGNADQVVTSQDLEKRGCQSLDDCLNGMLTGVMFRDGKPYSTRGGGPMLIVLDGIPQDNALEKNFLGTIPVQDVASIEVLRNGGYTSIYGARGGNGVIIITTKRGDEYAPKTSEPGMLIYTAKGYYRAREFYSPQYDDPKTNQPTADLRTTIFWKPNIITDKNGHASFEYYNAGTPGTYRVVIEGIGADGSLGYKTFNYKVQ
ncbi:MAG: TonB-dependent receptor [Mucilaginibacter sp.]|nr:TonB-dependent receptor [Mucilaginibacter sp.]